MTKYVQNEEGGIHSVTDEHFEEVLHETTNAGRSYLLPGWKEVTEAQARKANPQLFGAPDPNVVMTLDEIVTENKKRKAREEYLRATASDGDDGDDPES